MRLKARRAAFGPFVDGKLLTEPVPDTYAAGKQAHVPLLAGWNRDEGSFFAMRPMTAEQFKGMIGGLYKERAAEFLTLYPAETDAQALRSAIDYGSDNFIAFGTWKWIEAHRKTGESPVYRYHLELARSAQQISTPAPSPSTPTTSSTSSARSTRAPARTVAARGSQAERADDELLDQLRQDRRSQRTGIARVAEVRHERLAHPPRQHHHLRPGHAAPAL
jgi:hypothetical protein